MHSWKILQHSTVCEQEISISSATILPSNVSYIRALLQWTHTAHKCLFSPCGGNLTYPVSVRTVNWGPLPPERPLTLCLCCRDYGRSDWSEILQEVALSTSNVMNVVWHCREHKQEPINYPSVNEMCMCLGLENWIVDRQGTHLQVRNARRNMTVEETSREVRKRV